MKYVTHSQKVAKVLASRFACRTGRPSRRAANVRSPFRKAGNPNSFKSGFDNLGESDIFCLCVNFYGGAVGSAA